MQARLVFGICFLLLSSVLAQESDEWDTSCQRNSDCVLKNRDNGFSCCFAGVCDSIDYSTPAWQAVNSDWWEAGNEACPTDCEQPLCNTVPEPPVGIEFIPTCKDDVCEKISVFDLSSEYVSSSVGSERVSDDSSATSVALSLVGFYLILVLL